VCRPKKGTLNVRLIFVSLTVETSNAVGREAVCCRSIAGLMVTGSKCRRRRCRWSRKSCCDWLVASETTTGHIGRQSQALRAEPASPTLTLNRTFWKEKISPAIATKTWLKHIVNKTRCRPYGRNTTGPPCNVTVEL